MGGILDGVTVVDTSTGIAGAMATMLLADHGASVVAIEPGDGRSFGPWDGRAVWLRGRRSVVADPNRAEGAAQVGDLVAAADVVVDDADPGGPLDRLLASAAAADPALIRCSISAYGGVAAHAGRPSADALVAARMGLQWDQRGAYGGLPAYIADVAGAGFGPPADPAEVAPDGAEQTGHREGPIYQGLPWPSIGAALLATAGISAALRVRLASGRGQLVTTSLHAGGLLTAVPTWQRVPEPTIDGYRLPYFDRRHPKGFFRCRDGRWVHQWAPILHDWVQAAAAGDRLAIPEREGLARRPPPAGYDAQLAEEMAAHPVTAAAFARFDRDDWVALFAEAGLPCQPVRSPEEGLDDPWSQADGCVTEVDGPDGPSRQVGEVYRFSAAPFALPIAAPAPGTGSTRPEAARVALGSAPLPAHALAGISVIDLGMAMAGPYGTQTLADLGAAVIKIHNPGERHQPVSSPTIGCNRGKRSLALDLKDRRGTEILHRLAARADVVHHNLRTGVAERLAADDTTLRALNPRLIYCHTRGFEASGPRTALPGNDQMGQALAGTWFEMGGMADGGAPAWHPAALGDFGNGVASAIAVIQALYHRDRTGEGQRVDTSIINVGLLYNSYVSSGGRPAERAHLDAGQHGFDAWHRLYATADGWVCVDAPTAAQRRALAGLAGAGVEDPDVTGALTAAMAADTTDAWTERLDRAGVPAEASRPTWIRDLWDDPDLCRTERVVGYPHPTLGRVEQAGHLVELAATPGHIQGVAPLVGQHSREILGELGYTDTDVTSLLDAGVVHQAGA